MFDSPLRQPENITDRSRATPVQAVAFAWLAFLTVCHAVSHFFPHGPYDARTGLPVHGLSLGISFWGAVLEPLSALGHIMAGAPESKMAMLSFLCWTVAGAIAIAVWRTSRGPSEAGLLAKCGSGFCAGLLAAALFGLYVAFALLVHLPNWTLSGVAPGTIVADLHSHTVRSHDGLASFPDSMQVHGGRGYNLVALTEHYDPNIPAAIASEDETLEENPAALPGLEQKTWRGHYLLQLGGPAERNPGTGLHTDSEIRRYIEAVHAAGGAVLATPDNLRPNDLQYLADLGVDGFEIVDTGHPHISRILQAAMAKIQKRDGLILTADTNWHGWTGFLDAWNVIMPGRRAATPQAAVLSVLRSHDYTRIVPVVAGPVGIPPLARVLFAPFAECLRYGLEITTPQFLSWWLWVLLLGGLASLLTRAGYPAARCLSAAGLLFLGGGITLKAIGITWVWVSGATPYSFSLRIALIGIGVATIALISFFVLAISALRDGRPLEARTAWQPDGSRQPTQAMPVSLRRE